MFSRNSWLRRRQERRAAEQARILYFQKGAAEFIQAHTFSWMMQDMSCRMEAVPTYPNRETLERWLADPERKLVRFRTTAGDVAVPPGVGKPWDKERLGGQPVQSLGSRWPEDAQDVLDWLGSRCGDPYVRDMLPDLDEDDLMRLIAQIRETSSDGMLVSSDVNPSFAPASSRVVSAGNVTATWAVR